jgi:hypothetical protein
MAASSGASINGVSVPGCLGIGSLWAYLSSTLEGQRDQLKYVLSLLICEYQQLRTGLLLTFNFTTAIL